MGKFFKTAQEDKKPITATASVEAAKAVISDATKAKAKTKLGDTKSNTLQKVYKSEEPNTFIDTVMNKMSQFQDPSKRGTRSGLASEADAKAKPSSGSTDGAKAKASAPKDKSLIDKAVGLFKEHGRGQLAKKVYEKATGE